MKAAGFVCSQGGPVRTGKFWIAAGALIVAGTLAVVNIAAAQTDTPPTDGQTPMPTTNSGVATLQDMGVGDAREIELSGVNGVQEFSFYLPNGWVPQEGSTLDLTARYTSTSGADDAPGAVEVWVNGTVAGAVDLANVGTTGGQISLQIPPQVWEAGDPSGLHTLRFKLITAQSCNNIVRAYISTASQLNIIYDFDDTMQYTFATYPRLFAPNNFQRIPVVFVLPSEASAADLATAASVAARLGRLGAVPRLIHSISDRAFDPDTYGNAHLIVIGEPASNILLPEVSGGHESEVEPGVGMLHIQASPWNAQRAVIVVTGGDEAGVNLAGRALSSQASISALSGTHAVVTEVPGSPTAPRAASGPLSGLGYADVTRRGVTGTEILYEFDLDGYAIEPGGFIELRFAHSNPLMSGASSITVAVNGIPVGSVELNEQNSQNGVHRFALPPNLSVWRGNNVISVQVKMIPAASEECPASAFTVDDDWPWITLYSTSSINLVASGSGRVLARLDDFPRPFEASAGLANTVFVLPESPEPGVVDAFLKINARLGNRAREATYAPVISMGNARDLPADATVIAIGRPSANGYITGLNAILPQPFEEGTDRASSQGNPASLGLTDDYGVIQLVTWERGATHTTLVVTGTTDDMLRMAADVLTSESEQVKGDLVFIMSDQRVVGIQTERPEGGTAGGATGGAAGGDGGGAVGGAAAGDSGGLEVPTDAERPVWAIPIVIAAASALLGIILIAAYLRNRAMVRRAGHRQRG